MASTSGVEAAASSTSPSSKPNTSDAMPSSSVEMSELTIPSAPAAETTSTSESRREEEDATAGAEQQQDSSIPNETTITTETQPTAQPTSTTDITEQTAPSPPRPTRAASEAALGPATDAPIAAPPPSTPGSPCLSITLMLTTGARHPYKIDEKYLKNRKVEARSSDGTFDPRDITAYKLKELIWTDWRSEWEPRPASPSSIRLIILGRLMEDNAALRDFPFKLDDTNTVHMTVKPADFLEDDDTGGKKKHAIGGADGQERDAGCCRCVIL